MASARDAPFGTDATPEIIVKIIGSKYIQCIEDKPYIKGSKYVNSQAQTEVIKHSDLNSEEVPKDSLGVKTPGSDNGKCDLNWEHKEEDDKEQHITKASAFSRSFLDDQDFTVSDVQCLTAPTGDQTLSFIHTFRKPQSAYQQNICQRPLFLDNEDDALVSTIRNDLKLYKFSAKELENFQEDLNRLDPTGSGFLRQSQISLCLLRQQLPLTSPTIKVLFKKFAKLNDPELVNYATLLQFLKLSLSDKSNCAQDQEPGEVLPAKSVELDTKTKRIITSPAADEKVLKIVRDAMKECSGTLDLEKISLVFLNKDKSHSGLLPAFEIVLVFQQHGLTISPLLLKEVLCSQHMCIKGRIRWQTFVELLHKAHSDANLQLPKGTEKNGVCSMSAFHNDQLPIQQKYLDLRMYSDNEKTSRPSTQPVHQVANLKDSKQHESWIDRFGKLEKALCLCDTQNTAFSAKSQVGVERTLNYTTIMSPEGNHALNLSEGKLEKERAKRLIHNYNHIYNLALSPLRIDQALQKFHCGDSVTLEPVFQYLKEL